MLTAVVALPGYNFAFAAQEPAAPAAQLNRVVGTIKSVQANLITLSPDTGPEITVSLKNSTRILRVEPGQTDLKSATQLQAQDLHAGDRILVRGQGSSDGQSIAAVSVIVMKQADVAAKQAQDRADWQRHGVGGLVTVVDRANGVVEITAGGLGATRNLTIHADKVTIVRRYAAGSVKFEDAQLSSLDLIKAGDQLRARGEASADGKEITAKEIVFGTFRNIAGTITAVDASNNSVTVQDAIAKSSVTVKVVPDSQMKKLAPEMAQRIAMRLKAGSQAPGQGAQNAPNSVPASGGSFPSQRPGGMGGGRSSGASDFDRLLSRVPDTSLANLQKGDAVMIVAAPGENGNSVSAITLLAGVEPILTAAPNRAASLVLSPWTLNSSNAEAESAP